MWHPVVGSISNKYINNKTILKLLCLQGLGFMNKLTIDLGGSRVKKFVTFPLLLLFVGHDIRQVVVLIGHLNVAFSAKLPFTRPASTNFPKHCQFTFSILKNISHLVHHLTITPLTTPPTLLRARLRPNLKSK